MLTLAWNFMKVQPLLDGRRRGVHARHQVCAEQAATATAPGARGAAVEVLEYILPFWLVHTGSPMEGILVDNVH